MLVCSDDLGGVSSNSSSSSSSTQQQQQQILHTTTTSSSILTTGSDNVNIPFRTSSLLQIDTSGAFANTTMDAPLFSRNSGPGSGNSGGNSNSSTHHRELSLLSPLARIGSVDEMEPTPRRKARRLQENARLGGKSPAVGSMSPGPLTKKRSFSLDGLLTYTPAIVTESLRYFTADELGYSSCPYFPQDVTQYLLRAPKRLLPTQDPSVRLQEVNADTDVDASYSESKMDVST